MLHHNWPRNSIFYELDLFRSQMNLKEFIKKPPWNLAVCDMYLKQKGCPERTLSSESEGVFISEIPVPHMDVFIA